MGSGTMSSLILKLAREESEMANVLAPLPISTKYCVCLSKKKENILSNYLKCPSTQQQRTFSRNI